MLLDEWMRFTFTLVFLLISTLSWSKDYTHLHKQVFYPDRLNLPTNVEKFGENYFIVDSYNNRVIYSDNLALPISEWNRLGENIPMSWPHSIASDGLFYLIDDTYQNRLLVFKYQQNAFVFQKALNDIAKNPHRVLYDKDSNAFYLLGALSQTITKLSIRNEEIEILYTKKLDFLGRSYSRSIHIIDGLMFFISGPGKINVVNYKNDSFKIVNSYQVPEGFESMNDIVKVGNYYYLTASMKKMIRCESLDEPSNCVDVYEDLGIKGNPYYFSFFDNAFYLTEIASNGIIKFTHDNNGLKKPIYYHRP